MKAAAKRRGIFHQRRGSLTETSAMDERQSVLIHARRSARLRPPLEMKEQMNMQIVFVLVMKWRTKQPKYVGSIHNDVTDVSLFRVFRPPCVTNLSSSKGVVDMDRDRNTMRYCSTMGYVYDVHVYDFECVLPAHGTGPTFPVTGGCALVECLGEIKLSKNQNDGTFTGNREIVSLCRTLKGIRSLTK